MRARNVTAGASARFELERWELSEPFRIAHRVFDAVEVVVAYLERDGCLGRGEAAGVYFVGDTPAKMIKELSELTPLIKKGLSLEFLQRALPAGGARNALDCAYWDLEAKTSEQPAWRLAGMQEPHPLLTTFGCGADTPHNMARQARNYTQAKAIKLKLTGEPIDADRVIAVREARPDVWLSVDANQGFTRSFFEDLLPTLIRADVSLVEQPLPIGDESLLRDFACPIPLAADESIRTREDIAAARRWFDVINIKLDKCGGLTEALAMARSARALGLKVMVGNMLGTSLAMAPAFLVGQLCDVIDLDGPLFLTADRPDPVQYHNGLIDAPEALWGHPDNAGQ